MRSVLLTGGAGFIGSNLVRLLLRERVENVVVLDNLTSGYRRNLDGLPVRVVEGDVRNRDAVEEAIRGCDTVFHLAASVGNARSIANPIEDALVNVLGTLTVLEAARDHGVKKLVYSSSAGIFGELKQLPIDEGHPVEPDTPYGCSKLAGEKLCLSYAKLYPISCVCLRYFNVYGPMQRYDAYGNVIPIFAHLLLHGRPLTVFGDGEQTRDFVNVHDVARANFLAARASDVSGAFNIGSATRVSINELIRLMEHASGVRPEVRYASPREGDVRDSLADISAARAKLNFEPNTRLSTGLTEYMDWFRAELELNDALTQRNGS
ncbi:MAG: NAD-dependent epimerase/dehydratase family protein [Acidobacteria bacterium]|nr:NAD-dependent epimerase/dehydratase family protein [Acidobacteriota bacterium]